MKLDGHGPWWVWQWRLVDLMVEAGKFGGGSCHCSKKDRAAGRAA